MNLGGGKALDMNKRLGICVEVAEALTYLDSAAKPIVHGRLTSANILLTDRFHVSSCFMLVYHCVWEVLNGSQ